MKKAAIVFVFILSIFLGTLVFINTAYAQTTPSCGAIKTTNGTSLNNLLSGRTYTLTAENCQNANTYQWLVNKINCPMAPNPSTGSSSTFDLTTPQLSYAGQTCSLEAVLRVCNTAGQCTNQPSYSAITVKYALPQDAKQWTFNVSLSCQNGATPINVNVNTTWNFLNSGGSAVCQPNSGESRGSTQTALTFSETFSSAPSLCSQGIYNISKIAEGESATFKDASSNLISPAANDPGTATWQIASLPAGSYSLNYYLPSSSCPPVTTAPTNTPRPSPCNGIGDVNSDGKVDEADALLVGKYLADILTPNADEKRRADVNGNGNLEIDDSLEIRKYAAGIINTFPACTPNSSDNTNVCDPDPTLVNNQRVINGQDLAVVLNELAGLTTTNKGACLNNTPGGTTNGTALARVMNIIAGLENFPQQ